MNFNKLADFFGNLKFRAGKWLCKQFGNWDDFVAISTSADIIVEPNSAYSTTGGIDVHVPWRMISSKNELTFNFPNAQIEKQNDLVRELWKIPGVTYINISSYQILIFRGKVFSFEEMKPKILHIIRKYASKSDL